MENGLIVTPKEIIDNRPIETLTFGLEAPFEEREAVTSAVRRSFKRLGCETGGDIARLGCTGLATKLLLEMDEEQPLLTPQARKDHVIESGTFLRLGLAGSGVGLTCFVPPDKFCLVHNTIGGLERGQEQRYPEVVQDISRPLTPLEAAHTRLVEYGRRRDKGSMSKSIRAASELLSGIDEKGAQEVLAPTDTPLDLPLPPITPPWKTAEALWKCPEHSKTVWTCRYCVAQTIVEGDLEPTYVVQLPANATTTVAVPVYGVSAENALTLVEQLNEDNQDWVFLNVRVATFRRKLARE